MTTILPKTVAHAELYDQDYFLRLEQLEQFLRSQNFAALDLENFIEEIAEISGSQK
jgi:hypothetical protein